jgi:hypothetical protein
MTYFFAVLGVVVCFLLYSAASALGRLSETQEKRLRLMIDSNSRMNATFSELGDAAPSMMGSGERPQG